MVDLSLLYSELGCRPEEVKWLYFQTGVICEP